MHGPCLGKKMDNSDHTFKTRSFWEAQQCAYVVGPWTCVARGWILFPCPHRHTWTGHDTVGGQGGTSGVLASKSQAIFCLCKPQSQHLYLISCSLLGFQTTTCCHYLIMQLFKIHCLLPRLKWIKLLSPPPGRNYLQEIRSASFRQLTALRSKILNSPRMHWGMRSIYWLFKNTLSKIEPSSSEGGLTPKDLRRHFLLLGEAGRRRQSELERTLKASIVYSSIFHFTGEDTHLMETTFGFGLKKQKQRHPECKPCWKEQDF